VEKLGTTKWRKVAAMVPGRTKVQCYYRWSNGLFPGLKKGNWSSEEDELLRRLVARAQRQQRAQAAGGGTEADGDTVASTSSFHTHLPWAQIAQEVPGRVMK